ILGLIKNITVFWFSFEDGIGKWAKRDDLNIMCPGKFNGSSYEFRTDILPLQFIAYLRVFNDHFSRRRHGVYHFRQYVSLILYEKHPFVSDFFISYQHRDLYLSIFRK